MSKTTVGVVIVAAVAVAGVIVAAVLASSDGPDAPPGGADTAEAAAPPAEADEAQPEDAGAGDTQDAGASDVEVPERAMVALRAAVSAALEPEEHLGWKRFQALIFSGESERSLRAWRQFGFRPFRLAAIGHDARDGGEIRIEEARHMAHGAVEVTFPIGWKQKRWTCTLKQDEAAGNQWRLKSCGPRERSDRVPEPDGGAASE